MAAKEEKNTPQNPKYANISHGISSEIRHW